METERSETYLIITAPAKKQSAIAERIGSCDEVEQFVCDNVYQGMAETFKMLSDKGLSDSGKLVIVLVWADNLTLGQMEFFTLLKEHGSVVTLAVSDNNEVKLQTALKAGADRAMLLANLRAGLFSSIVSEVKRGRAALIEDEINDCEEESYDLLGDQETMINEIPADSDRRSRRVVRKRESDDPEESEVAGNNDLKDISLSEEELRSLLDED